MYRCLIGAAVGAIVGGVAYAIANNGENFNWGEAAVAAGAGAVTGALIGSGAGILAAAATAIAGGVTTTAAVGAAVGGASVLAAAPRLISSGTAALTAGGSYIAETAGGNFESGKFLARTGIAAVSGAITSDPAMGLGAKVGLNVAFAEGSYMMTGNFSTPQEMARGMALTGAFSAAAPLLSARA